jgi:integrase/recombinase XerD
LNDKFEQFLKERRYLKNVSPNTELWHRASLKWLPNPDPSQDDLNATTFRMREAGLSPISCNSRRRSINAYLNWMGSPNRMIRMKEPQIVLPTFTEGDVKAIAKFRPRRSTQARLQLLLLTLADTGCRISEILDLRWDDVDFDNLLLIVTGKGNKQRLIPFSFELRRLLFRWQQKSKYDLVFHTRDGMRLRSRNMERDTYILCEELKIKAPRRVLHAMRHTFAIHYIRRGGSVFHLQKVLGHSSLEMSRRYANLTTDDLQAIHQRVSLLS